MRRFAMLMSLFGMFAVGFSTLTAGTAIAVVPPSHEVFFDEPLSALPDINCGAFTIRETSFHSRVDVITYFDAAGDPARVHLHVQVHGVLTNLASGATLRDHGAYSQSIDLDSGTVAEGGISFHYSIPHQGLQLATNGRIVFNQNTGELLFQAGHFDLSTDLTPICSLLD